MNTNGTTRVEFSMDGVNWQPAFLRAAAPVVAQPDTPLPEGYRWCAVHETGKPVRWVAMIDVDCGRS